eukprot:106208_1
MADVDFKQEEPIPYPWFWLFYLVSLKGLQAGSIAGLAMFALRMIVFLITSPKQNNTKQNKFKLNHKNISAYETPLATLQRCIFHGTMHAFTVGCMVAAYLSYMSFDMVKDRTYRIFNAPFQNQVDYLTILGATMGLLCGKFVFKYNKKNDPFVRKSMFQKVVVPT